MRAGATITGLNDLFKKMAVAGMNVQQEAASSLYTEAELLMTDSEKECPVETDTLRTSSFVDAPVINGSKVSVKLGYGGAATKINPKSKKSTDTYAIYVHERTDVHHPVGKAHFLSDPYNDRLPSIKSNIANRLTKRLESL
jgi:hypothetical protein